MDYEVRGEDQERIEMNETADALKEDDQSDMCNAEHIRQLPLYKTITILLTHFVFHSDSY